MKLLPGLFAVIDKYDLLLLDLWGVVHDGSHLYPGVLDVITNLHAANKKIVFISNAPRRAKKVAAVLAQLGVGEELYDFAVSSGEVGFQWLAEGSATWGKDYFYIGPDKDIDVLDGIDYRRVDSIAKANFLVNVGFGSEEQTNDDYLPLLKEARALNQPMLCLNPDLEVVKQTGERFPCAGVIARQYVEIGGEVTWFGKPYPAIYDYVRGRVGDVPKSRCLAIGDSIDTDIAGGVGYGIDTMLITGGILHEYTEEQVREKTSRLGLLPNYHMRRLVW